MTDELARFRGTVQRLRDLFTTASGGYHEDLYLGVVDGRLEAIMQTNQRAVVSYCTFEEDYFGSIDGETQAIVPVGGSISDSKGFLDYLGFAEGSDTVEVVLLGDDPDDLATHLAIEGSLNARIRLPAGSEELSKIPLDHPPRWTPDNQYCSKTCLVDGRAPDDPDDWVTGPVVIETTADTIREQIVKPADFTDGVNYYPISVVGGEFEIEVEGSQANDAIWGRVNAESVEGPDCNREFQVGFSEIFSQLDGPVRLQTAPEGDSGVAPPLTIVRDDLADRTIRHVVAALAERD